MTSWRELRSRFVHLVVELAKFGTVGATAAALDIGLSNLLWYVVGLGPLTAKVVSVTVAATVAFVGNRYWTWRHRARQGLGKEYFLYFVFNAVGLLISILALGFTVYVLRLDTPLARNLSANVIGGLILGTMFRFWAYRKWVFLPPEAPPVDPHTGLPVRD
ncbi:MAG TPA: GtrA family protein [Actinopolymorphaceae bacterium]